MCFLLQGSSGAKTPGPSCSMVDKQMQKGHGTTDDGVHQTEREATDESSSSNGRETERDDTKRNCSSFWKVKRNAIQILGQVQRSFFVVCSCTHTGSLRLLLVLELATHAAHLYLFCFDRHKKLGGGCVWDWRISLCFCCCCCCCFALLCIVRARYTKLSCGSVDYRQGVRGRVFPTRGLS